MKPKKTEVVDGITGEWITYDASGDVDKVTNR
jgi:hypothetical protein